MKLFVGVAVPWAPIPGPPFMAGEDPPPPPPMPPATGREVPTDATVSHQLYESGRGDCAKYSCRKICNGEPTPWWVIRYHLEQDWNDGRYFFFTVSNVNGLKPYAGPYFRMSHPNTDWVMVPQSRCNHIPPHADGRVAGRADSAASRCAM